jgi:hypothetical protein
MTTPQENRRQTETNASLTYPSSSGLKEPVGHGYPQGISQQSVSTGGFQATGAGRIQIQFELQPDNYQLQW